MSQYLTVKETGAVDLSQVLADARDAAIATLGRAAADSERFDAVLDAAFGVFAHKAAVADALSGIVSGQAVPTVELVDGALLQGADAAYVAATGNILVNADFVAQHAQNSPPIERVLLEEIGHFIDARIGPADAPGDEGAIFSSLVHGDTLDDATLAALKAEDDHGTITRDGRELQVEFATQYGDVMLNGDPAEWTAANRLDTDGFGVTGYELYGKVAGDAFVFALKADATVIGADTTFWLNTDQNNTTGHQIWGFAGGAEYNVNFDTAGVPHLYTGNAGETLVAGSVDHAYSADGRFIEFAVPRTALAGNPAAANVLVDVNNTVFIPSDYEGATYTVGSADTPPPPPPPTGVGDITLNGDLADWTAADRLETPGSGVAGYALYGKLTGDAFVFALQADTVAVGAETTFWLNTDQNKATGYQIWDFAGGAEYNVNFDAAGVPKLYAGAAGQTLVSDALNHAFSADGKIVEFSVPVSALAGSPQSLNVLVDVNNEVFLPTDYSAYTYSVGDGGPVDPPPPPPPPPSDIGDIAINGDLADWTGADRLEVPGSGVAGYELFGKYTGESFVFALHSDTEAVGENTTFWLNTDQNNATGHQIWGFAGGAEYNINFDAAGVPRLYTGGAGETLVSDALPFAASADGKTVEFAVPASALAGAPTALNVLVDVNDQVFLPTDYSSFTYTVENKGDVPPVTDTTTSIAIVYSETTAANFYDLTAYSQLFMAVQNQATQAGLPFDILSEGDLTNLSKLAAYETIVFPSFSHVPAEQLSGIEATLASVVSDYGVGIVAAGDFMVNDATGAALPGDAYARMKSLLGVTRTGGGNGDVTVQVSDADHAATDGYQPGEVIHSYDNAPYAHFGAVDGTATVLVEQQVGGQIYNAVVATQTGGRNVHFSTEEMLADHNLLWQALQWSAEGDGPSVGLQISRETSVFASRVDMDQSQESFDVNPDNGPGIYDALLPILQDWHDQFGFVGSYYVNIGDNPPDQYTDWNVSAPYYQQLLAMGNEIGTHSYTHPHDVDELTPAQIEYQFNQSKLLIEQQLGIQVNGAAVPGAPETVGTAQEIGQYFDYLTGGFSGIGAGYPGAFGYLSPDAADTVYLAPNMSFDFSLAEVQNLSPAEIQAAWMQEWTDLTAHADTPVVLWPWHDYAPTEWIVDDGIPSFYNTEMFTNFIAEVHASGAEFVTVDDLAQRISSFEKADIEISTVGDVITAQVTSDDVGRFALDVDGGQMIESVNDWYAYDDDSVFLPKNGGAFTINLGDTPTDVTHIVDLPSRAELLSVTGDGTNLSFSAIGDGTVVIDLMDPAGLDVQVTGAQIISLVDDRLELDITGPGQHDVSVTLSAANAGAAAVSANTPSTVAVSSVAEANALNATDLLTDFAQGNVTLDLSGIDADATTAGDQAFELLAEGGEFTAAGQLRTAIDTATGNTVVEGNVDGGLAADFTIDLLGQITVSSNDVVL